MFGIKRCNFVKQWLVSFCLVFVSVFGLADAAAGYEAVAFGPDFSGSDPCGGNYLGVTSDALSAIEDGFVDIGYPSADVETWTNLAVDGRDFTDGDEYIWGDDDYDPYATDWADVIWYRGHSGYSCSTGAYYSSFLMGDDDETCSPNTRDHIRWGVGSSNEEINIAVMFSCYSSQKCVWINDGYYSSNDGGWFAIWLGFHGVMQHTTAQPAQFESYIQGAEEDGVADDFIDWFNDIRDGADNDMCALPIVFGSNSTLRGSIYTYMGFKDFKDPVSVNASTGWAIPGCDPEGGPEL